jgi:hypothetical protein
MGGGGAGPGGVGQGEALLAHAWPGASAPWINSVVVGQCVPG